MARNNDKERPPGKVNYNTYKDVVPNYSRKRATYEQTRDDIGRQLNAPYQAERKRDKIGTYSYEKSEYNQRSGPNKPPPGKTKGLPKHDLKSAARNRLKGK
jgi:hypothetical protein